MSAFGIITIADFLMGPSNILFLPDYSAMFFIGYALSGLGTGMIYTPMLPEIIDSVYQKTGIVEGDDENLDALIADQASGLYFLFFSLGVILAPLLGSGIYSLLSGDWAYTCDMFAVMPLIFTVCFLVFNVIPDIRKEKIENENRIENV